jgi:phosphomannomutase
VETSPLMLSVSGLRGLVGKSLTSHIVGRYAVAFGQWLKENQGQGDGVVHVIVGRDSRPSGREYESAAVEALSALGCKVTRLGIVSTPGVAVMVRHLNADGGLVVTASHNPTQWNGLKPMLRGGVAPPADKVASIIDFFNNEPVVDVAGDSQSVGAVDERASHLHRDAITKYVDVEAIRSAKLKVVVDSVHGAGGTETRDLLDYLGVHVEHLYSEPTGLFAHEPEPTKQNLEELCQTVARLGVDVGFAQDPDADRLAIVDEHGGYIGEEYTLALTAMHVLQAGDAAVANLSTSRMIDDVAAAAGARVLRTPVGEANVAAGMQQHQAIIGGEGNGGVIWPRVSSVRDSFVGMALVLEMMARRQQTISKLVRQIPDYAIVKDKVPISVELSDRLTDVMCEQFAGETLDLQDGVRVDWPDRWVHVRPSNTEPILRIIAEAQDRASAAAVIEQVRKALGIA